MQRPDQNTGNYIYIPYSLQRVSGLLIQKYLCAVYDYAGKADLSKGCWNPGRKPGTTVHFLEIMCQQF